MIENFYLLSTKIYSTLFSFYENLLLRSNLNDNNLNHFKIEKVNILKIDYNKFEIKKINKYFEKIIFPDDKINKIIKNLFIDNNLAKKISNQTGFNYSIDFFTAYKTYKIDAEEKSQGWYANHFHKDKPYTNNMVKMIFSFDEITENDGPMEIIENNKPTYKQKNVNYKVTIKSDEVFVFYPTKVFHRATSPKNNQRFQIMFQLNPSKKWKINDELFIKQKKREPKFPLFSYVLNKKKDMFN